MTISICTTNYNCAHALRQHLDSLYRVLSGLEFEYIVVDNRSKDGSWELLANWQSGHRNMKAFSRRCTMGEGRQIAFQHSRGGHIMILDTDVVYSDLLRRFVDAYLAFYPHLSVQAVFCGLFPRDQWAKAGGRRSLNTNEDVDLWLRLNQMGTMRWYPIPMGENLKEPSAWGIADYLSRRYPRPQRILRLLRREWDLFKTKEVQRIDLQTLISPNIVDFDLGPPVGTWPQQRPRTSRLEHLGEFAREFKQVLLSS